MFKRTGWWMLCLFVLGLIAAPLASAQVHPRRREVFGALRVEGGLRNDEGPGGRSHAVYRGGPLRRIDARAKRLMELVLCISAAVPNLDPPMPRASTSGKTASSPMPTATTSS